MEHCEPLLKVSIVPRGTAALGFAQYLPNEDLLKTREQLEDMTCMTLGGRAAEEIVVGKVSTGAQNDLEKVTRTAYAMTAIYGFNPKVGLLSFPPDENRFDKPYSDDTAKLIDGEVREFVDQCYARTLALLREKKPLVEALAQALLKKEVLNLEDLESVLGPRPFTYKGIRNIDRYKAAKRMGDDEESGKEEEGKDKGGSGGSGIETEPIPTLAATEVDPLTMPLPSSSSGDKRPSSWRY